MRRVAVVMIALVLSFSLSTINHNVAGFLFQVSSFSRVNNKKTIIRPKYSQPQHGREVIIVPQDLAEEFNKVANKLWHGQEIPKQATNQQSSFTTNTTTNTNNNEIKVDEGEASLADGISFSDRAQYFRDQAMKGCPKAQHSYGLILWSGFGLIEQKNPDPVASAKFHAAAASQYHLDGMAVFGGCLRTGTGVERNEKLGSELINFCASVGNPSGVNKKAALLEAKENHNTAVELYEKSFEAGRVNALLLFNLGWCLVNGIGVKKKDRDRGISLWKEATARAPDEGSEEAAWYLYQEFKRDYPVEAKRWQKLAMDLGFEGE